MNSPKDDESRIIEEFLDEDASNGNEELESWDDGRCYILCY